MPQHPPEARALSRLLTLHSYFIVRYLLHPEASSFKVVNPLQDFAERRPNDEILYHLYGFAFIF